jgi:hypothetical protein
MRPFLAGCGPNPALDKVSDKVGDKVADKVKGKVKDKSGR